MLLIFHQKIPITSEYLKSQFLSLNYEKILTSLSEDIASGRYIFHTRLNNASSTNRKEGYQLLGQAIFPTAQIAKFSKDKLAKLA